MKTAKLKKLFAKYGETLEPPFILDESTKSYSDYISIKRTVQPGQWQFLALQFRANYHIFYVAVALSTSPNYPISALKFHPSDLIQDGPFYFRADTLWSSLNYTLEWGVNEEGWPPDHPDYKVYFPEEDMECVVNTAEEAVAHIKYRVEGWVLPYFESLKSS